MRCQNGDASRCFAGRAELCPALGGVEKRYDGAFQQSVGSLLTDSTDCLALIVAAELGGRTQEL